MGYYPAMKRNELSSHEKTCMNFKCILLNEPSPYEKTTFCMIPIMVLSGKEKSITSKKMSGCQMFRGRDGIGEGDF